MFCFHNRDEFRPSRAGNFNRVKTLKTFKFSDYFRNYLFLESQMHHPLPWFYIYGQHAQEAAYHYQKDIYIRK